MLPAVLVALTTAKRLNYGDGIVSGERLAEILTIRDHLVVDKHGDVFAHVALLVKHIALYEWCCAKRGVERFAQRGRDEPLRGAGNVTLQLRGESNGDGGHGGNCKRAQQLSTECAAVYAADAHEASAETRLSPHRSSVTAFQHNRQMAALLGHFINKST